mmetsp:Transcript_9759/g.34328  ORF Transcript_9759/g.34328 Transcript_9759/m.34328 type:complete len:99 (-) Transcript_9759:56-352(-)
MLRRLIPIADRVLVKRIANKTQSAGGVFLPEMNMPKMNEGEVIAVGPGAKDSDGKVIAMEVAVGDMVLLPEYGATPVKFDDEEYHLLRGADILAKFAK